MLQYRGLLGIGLQLHRLQYCFSTHSIMQLPPHLMGKEANCHPKWLLCVYKMYHCVWSLWLYWRYSTGSLRRMQQYISGGLGYCISTMVCHIKLCSPSPTSCDDGNDGNCHPKWSFCIIGKCVVHLAIAFILNWDPWSHTALHFWLVGIFLYSDKCPIMQQSAAVPSCYGEGLFVPQMGQSVL